MTNNTNVNIHNSSIGVVNNVVGGDINISGDLVAKSASEGNLQSQHSESAISSEEDQSQEIKDIVLEIRGILESLTEEIPIIETSPVADKRLAVRRELSHSIEQNSSFRERLGHALKAGGIDALKELLNHPLSSFVISFLEEWRKSNPS